MGNARRRPPYLTISVLLALLGVAGCGTNKRAVTSGTPLSSPSVVWAQVASGQSRLGGWILERASHQDSCVRLVVDGEERAEACGPAPSLDPEVMEPALITVSDPVDGEPAIVAGLVAPDFDGLELETGSGRLNVQLVEGAFASFPEEPVTAVVLHGSETFRCPVLPVDDDSLARLVSGCKRQTA